MTSKTSARYALRATGVALVAVGLTATLAQAGDDRDRDSRHGGSILIEKQGYFFVGGQYDNPANPTSMTGQMYVEYQIPGADDDDDDHGRRFRKYPIVMIHGGGHTGTGWHSRPDGKEGWATNYLKQGWPVYVVDRPGIAKSTSLGAFGNTSSVKSAEDQWAASEKAAPSFQWPQANLHTQWPGNGSHTHGDPNFDQYYAHLSPSGTASAENNQVAATLALLDRIGPAILMCHSACGPGVWRIGDTRPDLVKAIIALEFSGPPFYAPPRFGQPGGALAFPWGVSTGPLAYDPPVTDPAQIGRVEQTTPDAPDLVKCWMQTTPARQLPRLAQVPIMWVLSESSYHAPYDHCTSKYLTQAGVKNDFVKLADLGIYGHGHLFMVGKQNLQIARVVENWLTDKLSRRGRR